MARILFAALLLLFTLPAAAQTPGDSIAFVTADWHTTDLGRGAACRYAQVEMFGSRQSISVVSYPARHFATQIVQLDGKGETTGRMGEAADATAAINGSYFNMKTFTPITFVMVDCRVLGRTTPGELMRTNGIIAIRDKQGHDVAIFACDTTQYPRIARRYRAALAAGPLLVSGGKIIEYDSGDSFYTHRHPRSLIGKRPNGDGRDRRPRQRPGCRRYDRRNGLHRPPVGAHGRPQPRRRRFFGTLDSTGRGGQPPQRQPPLRPCRRTRRTERHRRPSAEIKGQS